MSVNTDFKNNGFVYNGRLIPILKISYTKSAKAFKIDANTITSGAQLLANNVNGRNILRVNQYYTETPKGGEEFNLDAFIDDLPIYKGEKFVKGVKKVKDLKGMGNNAFYNKIKELIKGRYNSDKKLRKNEIIVSKTNKLYDFDVGNRQYDTARHYQEYVEDIKLKTKTQVGKAKLKEQTKKLDKANKNLRGAKAKVEEQTTELQEKQQQIVDTVAGLNAVKGELETEQKLFDNAKAEYAEEQIEYNKAKREQGVESQAAKDAKAQRDKAKSERDKIKTEKDNIELKVAELVVDKTQAEKALEMARKGLQQTLKTAQKKKAKADEEIGKQRTEIDIQQRKIKQQKSNLRRQTDDSKKILRKLYDTMEELQTQTLSPRVDTPLISAQGKDELGKLMMKYFKNPRQIREDLLDDEDALSSGVEEIRQNVDRLQQEGLDNRGQELRRERQQAIDDRAEALDRQRNADDSEKAKLTDAVIKEQAKVSAANEQIIKVELLKKQQEATNNQLLAQVELLEAEQTKDKAKIQKATAQLNAQDAVMTETLAITQTKIEASNKKILQFEGDVKRLQTKLEASKSSAEATGNFYEDELDKAKAAQTKAEEALARQMGKEKTTIETQTEEEETKTAEEVESKEAISPPPPLPKMATPPTSLSAVVRSPLIGRKKVLAEKRQERAAPAMARAATSTSTIGSVGGFETADDDDEEIGLDLADDVDEYVDTESKLAEQTIQAAPVNLNTGAGSQAPLPPPPLQPPQGNVGPVPPVQPPVPPVQPPIIQAETTEGMTLDDKLKEGETDATEKEKADPAIETDGLDDISKYGYDKQVYEFAISQGRDFTYSQELVKTSKDAPKEDATERRKQILTSLKIYGYTIDIQKPKTNDMEEAIEIMTFIYLALDKFRLEREWKRAITMLPDMLENIGLNADEVGANAPPTNQQLGMITQFSNPQILANFAQQQGTIPPTQPQPQPQPQPQQQPTAQQPQNMVGRNPRIPNAPQGVQRVRIVKAQKAKPQKKVKKMDTRPRMNVKEVQFKMKKSRINPNLLFTNLLKQNPRPQGEDSIFKSRPDKNKRRRLSFNII